MQKTSKQITEKKLKAEHATLQETLGISNPMDNPNNINAYVLVQNPATMTMAENMIAQVRYDTELQKQEILQQSPQLFVDAEDTANREKNIDLESVMAVFLSQHQRFWVDFTATMKEFQLLSTVLLNKKS